MGRIVGLVACLALVLSAVGCRDNPNSPSGQVVYRVTGTATRVDVTYANSSGGTSQTAGATVPWTYAWSGAKADDFLYVSAQIVSASGSITVTIEKNGTPLQTSTASGFASIATASGRY